MKTTIRDYDKTIALLKRERDRIIDEAIEACKHPHTQVRELEYRSGIWVTRGPWLICLDCGLAEEGWGTGYWLLRHAEFNNGGKITSDEFSKNVLRRDSQETICEAKKKNWTLRYESTTLFTTQ